MKPIQFFHWIIACWVLCLGNVTVQGGITFTNLFSFSGTNGSEPEGQLLQTSDGSLYGTTRETTLEKNGNSGFGFFGHGTVFRITTNGDFATLASFAAFNDTNGNGAFPRAGLIEGTDGNLYGTTAGGGANRLGTVFKITTNGNLTFIASFAGTNGSIPQGGLLRGKKNFFYGTTSTGGLEKNKLSVKGSLNYDGGTVFSITSDGVLTTLAFFDGTNGADPNKIFIGGKTGNIYGTTGGGGLQNVVPTDNGLPTGFGTVFKINRDGAISTLIVFNSCNGIGPFGIQQDRDGNLFGVTSYGGATNTANMAESYSWVPYSGFGTVFKITPNGKFSTLVLFSGANGANPNSFISGKDGNFYGTTAGGGANNLGTIFRITPKGQLTTLYSFAEGSGTWPSHSTLMQGADGHLYGTTSRCGKNQCGSIFRLTLQP